MHNLVMPISNNDNNKSIMIIDHSDLALIRLALLNLEQSAHRFDPAMQHDIKAIHNRVKLALLN